MAEPAEIDFLRVGEAASVLTQDGLDAGFDFGMAFGGKLGEICGLLIQREPAGWIGKAPATVGGRYGCMFIQRRRW